MPSRPASEKEYAPQKLADSSSNEEFVIAESDIDVRKLVPSKIDFAIKETRSIKCFTITEPSPRQVTGINLEISVSHPRKVGSGLYAYLLFQVTSTSTTDLIVLKKAETSVERRFSDFIALHEILISKHRSSGVLVPPAPEKCVLENALAKFTASDEENVSGEFVEKRRGALERFLNRIARHPVLNQDEDYVVFLEQEGLLANSRPTFFSFRFVKFISRVLNKTSMALSDFPFSHRKDDWFEKKQKMFEGLEQQTHCLHVAFENYIRFHKDVAVDQTELAASLTMLGRIETDASFKSLIVSTAEVVMKLGGLHQEQSNTDYYNVSEMLNDHSRIFDEFKELYQIRDELLFNLGDANRNVRKMRLCTIRMEESEREREASLCREAVTKLEEIANVKKEEFKAFSNTLKLDMQRFEKDYSLEFRHIALMFLHQMTKHLEQSINVWEAFLPETAV